MATRGHGPYEGPSIQAPGMMRHGPFPGAGRPAAHRPLEPLPPAHRSLESLPPPELLEGKIAAQAAEIERLLRENQRLAATNEGMRQDIGANQQELQRIKSHIGSIRTEADIQVRGLLEKIRKAEDDIRAGETVKEELQQAHKEAKSLIITRQELTGEIQLLTEQLQKAGGDGKRLAELFAELDGLRLEHHRLRVAFEREKGSNLQQVEQMRAMDKNLISLAREVEKLRADVTSADKGERAANPCAGTYGSTGIDYGHGHGGGYPSAGFGHGSRYTQAYGQPQPHAPGGSLKGDGAGFADGYARLQTQISGGSDGYGRTRAPVAGVGFLAGEGMNQYPVEAARGGSIP